MLFRAPPRERRLLQLAHPIFLPSDQWLRASALCHSFLIHLSNLVRFTLSMACSISPAHAAFASLAAGSLGSMLFTSSPPEGKLSSGNG